MFQTASLTTNGVVKSKGTHQTKTFKTVTLEKSQIISASEHDRFYINPIIVSHSLVPITISLRTSSYRHLFRSASATCPDPFRTFFFLPDHYSLPPVFPSARSLLFLPHIVVPITIPFRPIAIPSDTCSDQLQQVYTPSPPNSPAKRFSSARSDPFLDDPNSRCSFRRERGEDRTSGWNSTGQPTSSFWSHWGLRAQYVCMK